MSWNWIFTLVLIGLGFHWVTDRLDRIGRMLEHWLPKFSNDYDEDGDD